ncbi:MAG: hypothetical protein K6E94_01020, partial [Elusimicrobiaceae bacterium]|nr:hypothetical protein [Elusimicrobiaceae bacterium]
TKAIADANERFYMVNNRYSTNFRELDVDITPNRLSNYGSIAYFDWGDCHLHYQQEIQCTNNTSLNNQFIKLYDLSTSSLRGGLYCTAAGMDENSRYYKVCENVGEFIRKAAGSCYELGDCGLWVIIGRNNW